MVMTLSGTAGLPETFLLHLIGKMPVCCGNNPDIGFLRFFPPTLRKLSHLKNRRSFGWKQD